MADTTVAVRTTRAKIKQALSRLVPAIAQGNSTASDAVMHHVGNAILTHIRKAFLVKARGGTDESGLKWKSLKKSTVLAKQRKAGGGKGNQTGRGRTGAKSGKGSSSTEILRSSGALLDSLSPEATAHHQIFRIRAGSVTIGTTVPYAKFHHEGTKRIPQRRLWPEVKNWPQSWWDDIAKAIARGIAESAAQAARNT